MSNTLINIFSLKCPYCKKGQLFETTVLSFKKWFEMRSRCNSCNQDLLREPGFYWGAMYISYGVSSFLIFLFFGIFYFGLNLDVSLAFFSSILVLAFLYPYLFRWSRSIWIHIFK